jgi:diguanylate cyclase (GGDEF)-like protein
MKKEELQKFVESFPTMTSILSVEKRADGNIGTIRIEAGNQIYIKSMERKDEEGNSVFTQTFVPGSNYERYMEKELNFEKFVYQSAILQKPVHAYIRPERFNFCINQFMMPIDVEDDEKGYCVFTLEIQPEEDLDTSTRLSSEISQNVLKACIKLRGSKDFKKTIDEVIEDVRTLCGASTCSVLLTDFKERTCSILTCARSDDQAPLDLDRIFNNEYIYIAESWIDTLKGSNCLIIQNEADMEIIHQRNPAWYESLTGAGVESLVLLPLMHNNEFIGFIWTTNFDTTKVLRIKETLELVTFFIASEVASYKLVQRLRFLSNEDLLTGVNNRNAMNNRVLQFVSGEVNYRTISVVFADLNGLKPINDNEGHNAGDALLKSAAEILKETFRDCEIYRAGGDEFVVVSIDVPKDSLEARVQKLRDKSKIKGNVSFAIGFFYDEKGGDVRKAMREADALMYEDKKAHYSTARVQSY